MGNGKQFWETILMNLVYTMNKIIYSLEYIIFFLRIKKTSLYLAIAVFLKQIFKCLLCIGTESDFSKEIT